MVAAVAFKLFIIRGGGLAPSPGCACGGAGLEGRRRVPSRLPRGFGWCEPPLKMAASKVAALAAGPMFVSRAARRSLPRGREALRRV